MEPCPSLRPGIALSDMCRDCSHTVGFHRSDRTCQLCEIRDQLRAELLSADTPPA